MTSQDIIFRPAAGGHETLRRISAKGYLALSMGNA